MVAVQHLIDIDLFDFVKSGKFDFVEIGMSVDEVLQVFPEPDIFDGSILASSKIWEYGSFELFFDEEVLYMIFTDAICPFVGGNSLNIINNDFSESLTIQAFQNKLILENVDYRVSHNKLLGSATIFIEASATELHFEEAEETDRKYLSALWKKKI